MEILIISGIIIALIWFLSKSLLNRDESFSAKEQPKVHQENESDTLLQQQYEYDIQENKQQETKKRVEEEKEKREKEQSEQEKKHSVWKSNWQDFQLVLQQNSINKLYHFTDISNIASIKKNGGLYSWWYCDQNNITISKPGGDNWSKNLDMRYGLQDYIRLSFTKNHPMMYIAQSQGRISNPVVLEVNLEVVFFKETRFSNMNATKTGHSQGATIDHFKGIKFNIVKQPNHFNLQADDKPYYQAEVMVKTFIPIEYITNINQF